MKKKLLLTGVAFGALIAGPALAADLARPVYRAPGAVGAPYVSWTGFYIGAHVGAGWGTKDWNATSFLRAPGRAVPTPDVTGATSVNGFLGGVQGGYNYQVGWAVFGAEAQWSGSHLTGSGSCFDAFAPGPGIVGAGVATTCSSTVRSLGTVAGRFGLSSDRTMLYLKGGWGWANDKFSLHSTAVAGRAPPFVTISYGDITNTRSGPMFGAGVEHALDGNWSAKIEYDYLDLGTRNDTFVGTFNPVGAAPLPATVSTDITQRIHMIKFGINYRFGYAAAAPAVYE